MIPRRTELLRPDLEENESVIWEGEPSTEVLARSHENPQYLYAGIFVIGAIMIGAGIPIFALFGIVLALYLIGGWRYWDAYVRSKTWYTLTNQRACIGKDFGLSIPVRSYSPKSWSGLRKISEGKLSTIILGSQQQSALRWINQWPFRMLRGKMDDVKAFELITDGDKVFDLMARLKRGEEL